MRGSSCQEVRTEAHLTARASRANTAVSPAPATQALTLAQDAHPSTCNWAPSRLRQDVLSREVQRHTSSMQGKARQGREVANQSCPGLHLSTCSGLRTHPCGALSPRGTSCSTWLARPAHTGWRMSFCRRNGMQVAELTRGLLGCDDPVAAPAAYVQSASRQQGLQTQHDPLTPCRLTASAHSQPAGGLWCARCS